ncbi:hypothetical protein ACA910_007320 [Epithemia clementina (nom. ined.)]
MPFLTTKKTTGKQDPPKMNKKQWIKKKQMPHSNDGDDTDSILLHGDDGTVAPSLCGSDDWQQRDQTHHDFHASTSTSTSSCDWFGSHESQSSLNASLSSLMSTTSTLLHPSSPSPVRSEQQRLASLLVQTLLLEPLASKELELKRQQEQVQESLTVHWDRAKGRFGSLPSTTASLCGLRLSLRQVKRLQHSWQALQRARTFLQGQQQELQHAKQTRNAMQLQQLVSCGTVLDQCLMHVQTILLVVEDPQHQQHDRTDDAASSITMTSQISDSSRIITTTMTNTQPPPSQEQQTDKELLQEFTPLLESNAESKCLWETFLS